MFICYEYMAKRLLTYSESLSKRTLKSDTTIIIGKCLICDSFLPIFSSPSMQYMSWKWHNCIESWAWFRTNCHNHISWEKSWKRKLKTIPLFLVFYTCCIKTRTSECKVKITFKLQALYWPIHKRTIQNVLGKAFVKVDGSSVTSRTGLDLTCWVLCGAHVPQT